MMKLQVKVSPSTIVEIEGEKQRDLFKAVASAYEVFGEKHCGLCGCTSITPIWRTVTTVKGKKTETFEYPEYRCNGVDDKGRFCGAKLALGTMNDDTGTLFPKRKLLANGKPPGKNDGSLASYGDHNGWTRFKGNAVEEEGETETAVAGK